MNEKPTKQELIDQIFHEISLIPDKSPHIEDLLDKYYKEYTAKYLLDGYTTSFKDRLTYWNYPTA